MKRDMDLIRAILFRIERSDTTGSGRPDVIFERHSQEKVSYHVLLAAQAGFIKARDLTNSGSKLDVRPIHLTWAGHEFIDAVRSDTLWEKAKSISREKTGTVSFEALKIVLSKLMRDVLRGGLPVTPQANGDAIPSYPSWSPADSPFDRP
jgi:hypothetical protein